MNLKFKWNFCHWKAVAREKKVSQSAGGRRVRPLNLFISDPGSERREAHVLSFVVGTLGAIGLFGKTRSWGAARPPGPSAACLAHSSPAAG